VFVYLCFFPKQGKGLLRDAVTYTVIIVKTCSWSACKQVAVAADVVAEVA